MKEEKTSKDMFTNKWIIENAIEIVDRYDKGILTIRALFYQLVSIGMTNSDRHYKRVVKAMIDARWENQIDFDVFSDRDRVMVGDTKANETIYETKVAIAKRQLQLWMTNYYKNRWENQPYYPEVLIEKKALEGVFSKVCETNGVALGACKGYPSLTFLYELAVRLKGAEMRDKKPIILYFGDYDPSGEDIPRSILENLEKRVSSSSGSSTLVTTKTRQSLDIGIASIISGILSASKPSSIDACCIISRNTSFAFSEP